MPSPMSEAKSARWYNARRFVPGQPWAGFDPTTCAVVLIDLINWQAHPEGSSLQGLLEVGSREDYDYITQRCAERVLPNLQAVLPAARAAGALVVHTRLASEADDYSDVVPAFQPYMTLSDAREGTWASQVLTGLGPEPGDLSIVKSGSGAFVSSGLDEELRALGIDTVIYCGVVTNACVLLTAGAGFDLGYRQYVIGDATAAMSQEDQDAAERFMDSYIAQVVDSAAVVSAFVSGHVSAR